MCTHPPREWFRGMLLPCADPECGGIKGAALKFPMRSHGAGMRAKYESAMFTRRMTSTPGGRRYAWELASISDDTEAREEADRRHMAYLLRFAAGVD